MNSSFLASFSFHNVDHDASSNKALCANATDENNNRGYLFVAHHMNKCSQLFDGDV